MSNLIFMIIQLMNMNDLYRDSRIRMEIMIDVLLVVIMAISGITVILRLWQDIIVAIGIELLIVIVGILLLQINLRLRHIEENNAELKICLHQYFEELGEHITKKNNSNYQKILDNVESIESRLYR